MDEIIEQKRISLTNKTLEFELTLLRRETTWKQNSSGFWYRGENFKIENGDWIGYEKFCKVGVDTWNGFGTPYRFKIAVNGYLSLRSIGSPDTCDINMYQFLQICLSNN